MKKIALLLITLLIGVHFIKAQSSVNKTKDSFVPNQLIVKFKKEVSLSKNKEEKLIINNSIINELLDELGGVICERIIISLPKSNQKKQSKKEIINNEPLLYKFQTNQDIRQLIPLLLETGFYEYVEPNYIIQGHGVCSFVPSDFYFNLGRQWGLINTGSFNGNAVNDADIDMEFGWGITKGNSNVTVAVLDAGTKLDHIELSGRLWENSLESIGNNNDDDGNGFIDDINGWDFVNSDNDPTDDNGHGTNVIGIIGATGNNGVGYAGVDWNCKLMTCKVLDSSNVGSIAGITSAIYYAVDNGADVINMSLGSSSFSTTFETAIDYAYINNVVTVASMGNNNDNITQYPAGYSNCIAVGATDTDNKRANPFSWSPTSGSNYGSHIDLVAPGNYIYGLDHITGNNYNIYYSGTSQAAPLVTGVVSLIKGINNTISPDSIRSLLHNTSVDLIGDISEDTPGWDQYYGYGLLNAFNVLKEFVTGKDTAIICSGESYTFTDGTSINNITSSYVYTSTILSASFCDSTVITYLFVDSTVFANASDTVISLGDSIILYGSGASNYTWDNGVIDSIAFAPDSTTTYTVTGNVSGNCNTDQITITVKTLPDLAVTSGYYSYQCPGDTLFLTNINDSSYVYYWTLNGIVLDTSYHLNFIIPDNGSNWLTHYVWLHVSNGLNEDSIKITIPTRPSGTPEQFTAWADPIVNCDGTYNIKIYPVYRTTSLPYNISNWYYYSNGSFYYTLNNLLSYSGDTATYSIPIHPDSVISIRATSKYCGGNSRDTVLNLPTNYYDFNLYPFDTDKENYCSYDTVRIKIPFSEPGAEYSISGNLFSNPIYGTGDTLEVIGWGNGSIYSYYSAFKVLFENTKGCTKSKWDTVFFEGVDPQFQFVLDGVNPSSVSYFYSLGDTILLNLKEDTSTINCVWTIESNLFDTTYTNCTDHYFVVNHPGNYSFNLTKTSLLGCVFESEKELFVAAGLQGFSQNLNCAYDTAFNTSWDYNWYQTLDIHEDKMGNFHIAGFYPKPGSTGGNKPVSIYNKFNKNKQSIYQRIKAAYSNLYQNSYFLSEHLNSVTTDENLNVYTSGQFYTTGNFRNDSTIQYNSSGYNHFVYIAKHDSSNIIKSLLLYVPYSTNSSNHQPVFSDIIYYQDKVYALFNGSYARGAFLEYNKQNQNWINSIDTELGMNLVIMDSSLHILDIEKVTSSWNSIGEIYNTGSTSTSAFNNRAAKLTVDKQGRILIHYVSGYHGPNGLALPIEYGNTTLTSNYYLQSPHSVSAIATYDPVNGWLNGTLVADGFVRNHNYIINNLESDIHGNKYVLSNFTFDRYQNSGTSYYTNIGIVGSDTVTQPSSTISKLDVNNNFIWNKHFQNCDVVDMKLTRDEEHIGVLVNAKGNKFYYGDNDTSMLAVNLNGNSTVFMQFSNNGDLEKIYEYGNGVKTLKGQFLHFNDEGYFQLNARISNFDTTDLILNGDTIYSPLYDPGNGSTHYNYITFSIDGENGQCFGSAYSGSLNDTLFLHIQNLDLCADSTVFIPWIATDTINQVNLGYYLNGSSTKTYITNNLNANDYGYMWNIPNFNNLDSLKFFIESTTPFFYNETNSYAFYGARDIVLLSDTTFCLGEEISLIPLDTFDLKWSPSQYFSNPELDGTQVLTLSDSTIIYIEERTDINSCVNHDTININIITLLVEIDSITLCLGDSVFLGGSYQYVSGTYTDSLQSYLGCDSIFSTTLIVNPLPVVGLDDFNSDTLCDNGSAVILPIGFPIGGNYYGNGIVGGNFDPSSAGVGSHNIIYTYTDENSCVNSDTTIITVDICTGVDNISSYFGIIIYPNPNTGLFTIEKPNGLNKEIHVNLLDATSRLIINKIIPIGMQKTEMDITKLSKGIYYLHISIDGEVFVKQILNN